MSEVNEERVAKMKASMEESNERRRGLLREVVEIAEHALAHQPEKTGECWRHFNDVQLALRQMMRPKPNTLAFAEELWWYKENDEGTGLGAVDPAAGSGAFTTPKSVMDDPALKAAVEPMAKPLSPDAPEMARGEDWHPLEIPECDIDFQRFHSQDCEVYICAWKSKGENIAHVYEVRCSRFEGQWRATLSNDGRTVGELLVPGRHTCYMLALGAMRAYLRSGHRKTISKAKKAAAALAGARSDAAEPTND